MESTRIVRRMDDLGRIVVPKEIRRAMSFMEGDPFEIYIDKEADMVCFKRFSTNENLIHQLSHIVDTGDLPSDVNDLLISAIKALRKSKE